MKAFFHYLTLVAILCLPVMTHAADEKKPAPKKPAAKKPIAAITVDTAAVDLIKPYDKDGNFEISPDEMKAMQADYKANPRGPLKALDLANDTFDDIDRMSMNNKLGAAKMVANPKPPVEPAKKKK